MSNKASIKNIVQSVLKSCLFKLFITTLIILVLVTGVLFYKGDLRFKVFRLAGEVPSIVNFYLFRGHVKHRHFSQAVYRLDKQLNFVQSVSQGNNHVLDGLLKNIEYCIDHAKTAKEYDQFQNFLKRFVTLYPDIYIARIWYATTLLNDSPDLVFEQVDQASKLASSDPRSYRMGIEAAQLYGLKEKFRQYCTQYNQNQLGGLTSFERNLLFYGLGLRAFVLEVEDVNGNTEYIENNGLRVGHNASYEFLLTNKMNLSNVKLHIASQPGIIFKLFDITLSTNGYIKKVFDAKDLTMTSSEGYFLDERSIIITSTNKSGVVNLNLPIRRNTNPVDKIVIKLRVNKAGLTNNLQCITAGIK
jgi:hypothetical protein